MLPDSVSIDAPCLAGYDSAVDRLVDIAYNRRRSVASVDVHRDARRAYHFSPVPRPRLRRTTAVGFVVVRQVSMQPMKIAVVDIR